MNDDQTKKLHLFTPRTKDGKRLRMSLDATDIRKIGRGAPWSAEVTDQETGKRYAVKGASCGSPRCFCDAVIVREIDAKAHDCTCHHTCGEDSHSGHFHQHEDEPCPVHPDAPKVG